MSYLFSLIFSCITLIGAGISLFFSYGIFKAVWSNDYFSVIPFFKKETSIESIYPYNPSYMTTVQRENLISNLIEDFLIYRYTILPDNNLMEQRMGIWWTQKYKDKKQITDTPYLFMTSNQGKNRTWKDFIDPAGGFAGRVMLLVKEGKTRTVEIISPPHKEKDFWEVRLKLKTYSPKTDDIEISYLKVSMAIRLKDYLRPSRFAEIRPALLFNFEVKYIYEIY